MNRFFKTVLGLISIVYISSCCKQDVTGASLTIDFIGYTQNELDSIVIIENKPDSTTDIYSYYNFIEKFDIVEDSKFEYLFFGESEANKWYIYENNSILKDSITNLEVKRITEKSGCPSRDRHELSFAFDNKDYDWSEQHSITVEK